MAYPKIVVTEWTHKGKKRKEIWWLEDPFTGEYLDTYSKCYFNCGQTLFYSKGQRIKGVRLPNKKELKALANADMKALYK